MTYEQFWYGDPLLCKYYRDAETYRFEQRNIELWLQGMYINEALNKCLSNAFSAKHSKKQRYPDHPYAITEREKLAEKQRKIEHTMKWVKEGIERSDQNG